MIALLDTNVILDALQEREPWAEAAKEIFLAAAREEFTGCVTAKALADIHYLTHRCTHSETAARATLDKLCKLFELLDTAAADCRRALVSEVTDYEDAIMIETAVRVGADCIVTRNLADYRRAPLKVCGPDDFLTMLHREQQ